MASTEDIEAIEGPGGIAVTAFPGLERRFDYQINDFSAFGLDEGFDRILAGSFNLTTDTQSSVDLGLNASSIVAFDSWSADAVMVAEHRLSHSGLFTITSAIGADAYFEMSSVHLVAPLLLTAGAEVELVAGAVGAVDNLTSISTADVGVVFESTVTLADVLNSSAVGVENFAAHVGTIDDLTNDSEVDLQLHATSVVTITMDSNGKASNPFYREDGIENLPVWMFEANWVDDLTETLEWQTDVLTSPTGAEQRRALRRFPRRSLEFRIMAIDRERSYLDNSLMKHGSHDWWLPQWHQSLVLGSSSQNRLLPFDDAEASNFMPGDILFLRNDSFFEYGMAVVDEVDSEGVHLTRSLLQAWPANTIVYRVQRARLTEQPKLRREADNAVTAQVQFRVVEQNAGSVDTGLSNYRGFPVLTDAPNEVDRLEYAYERMVEEVDNRTGIPSRYDSAGIAFPTQRYAWLLEGYAEHAAFMSMIYAFRGRQSAFWLPTFFNDLELAQPVGNGDETLTVELCGYTELGGPTPSRQDIMIEMIDGSLIMRRIEASIISEGREILAVDAPFDSSIDPASVVRISFMALSRLNQDVVEIQHKTDESGVSTVAVTMRNVPDLRQVASGF